MGIGIRTTIRSVIILTTVAISKRASSFEHPLPSLLVQYRCIGLEKVSDIRRRARPQKLTCTRILLQRRKLSLLNHLGGEVMFKHIPIPQSRITTMVPHTNRRYRVP
jgi:hypothetical protein